MAIDPVDPNGTVGLYVAAKDEGGRNLRVWYLTGACDATPHYREFDRSASIDALNSIVVYADHMVQFFEEDVPVPDGKRGNYRSYSVVTGSWSGSPPHESLTLSDATAMFTRHDRIYNENNGGQTDSEIARAPGSDKLYATFVNWTNARVAPWLEIVSSTDRGKTWSNPLPADIPASPYIADGQSELMINPAGTIGVSFLRVIRGLGRLGEFPCYSYDVFFAASPDGGKTWSSPSKLAGSPSVPDCIKQEGSSQARWTGGDFTIGAADAGGAFHPIWPDWRKGPKTPGTLYTRTVIAP